MPDWNALPPDQQRQELAHQMEVLRWGHLTALSETVEALARARELLAVPVYEVRAALGGGNAKAR